MSHAAMTSGLEWNLKVTAQDLPHIVEKFVAEFETYWNSREFMPFSAAEPEILREAIRHARTGSTIAPVDRKIAIRRTAKDFIYNRNTKMKPQDSVSKIVPEQVVEAAWFEIGELSEDQARLHMQRLSRRQPALLAFVTAFSEDLNKDGAELAIYMFVAIVHMFEMHFGKRLQNVGPKRIESMHEENVKTLDRLTGAHERWLERAAVAQSEKQPWVWKYVVECLFEPDDQEINLSEEDLGSLAIIMRTVVDALDSSVR